MAVWFLWFLRLLLVIMAINALVQLYNAVSYRSRLKTHLRSLPRSQDASDQGLTPPRTALPLVTALQGVGFTRLGEVQATFPKASEPMTIWVFVDEDRTTMADVSVQPGDEGEAFATLASRFADEAYVYDGFRLTMGALSKPVEDDDFHAHYHSDHLAAAYRDHCRQVAEMAARHGAPLRYEGIEHYVQGEDLFKERYVDRQIASAVRAIQRRLLAANGLLWLDLSIGVSLFILVRNIFTRVQTLPEVVLGWLGATALTLAAVASFVISRQITRVVPGTRRRR